MEAEYNHIIEPQPHLIGINTFAKKYSLNRPELMRIIAWGGLSGIAITDGGIIRIFINNDIVLAEAKANHFSPMGWVARLARLSKK
jgi:hypothetical protein